MSKAVQTSTMTTCPWEPMIQKIDPLPVFHKITQARQCL